MTPTALWLLPKIFSAEHYQSVPKHRLRAEPAVLPDRGTDPDIGPVAGVAAEPDLPARRTVFLHRRIGQWQNQCHRAAVLPGLARPQCRTRRSTAVNLQPWSRRVGRHRDTHQPAAQFFAWLGQAQYVRRFYQDWEVLTRASLQLSHNPLFPIEQFVLGGLATVRGYREYFTQQPTMPLRGPSRCGYRSAKCHYLCSTTKMTVSLSSCPSTIMGSAGTPGSRPETFRPVERWVGLRWFVGFGIAAEVYYGYALRPVSSGNTLQDHGVHFRVTSILF